MFTYCLNNPLLGIDPTGEIVVLLATARAIHNQVADRVAEQVNGKQNVYVKKTQDGKVRRGFLDVYDKKKNSYYEVKSDLSKNSWRTKRQMEKYDGSTAVKYNSPPITGGTEYVSGDFSYGIYDVSFRYEKAGLVTYTVDINPKRAAQTAIMVMIGVGLAMFSGSPAALGLAFA